MEKQPKRKTMKKIAVGAVTVCALGTSLYAAAAFLNWTGYNTMHETNRFMDVMAEKILKQESLIGNLRQEIESRPEGPTDQELQNQIIEKNNEIDHLRNELTRANEMANEQQIRLDAVKEKLKHINLEWTPEN